jgi:hypothetical protein
MEKISEALTLSFPEGNTGGNSTGKKPTGTA